MHCPRCGEEEEINRVHHNAEDRLEDDRRFPPYVEPEHTSCMCMHCNFRWDEINVRE